MSANPSVQGAAEKLGATAVDGFHQLAQDIDGGFGELGDAIRSEINAHPLRTVLLAAGAGYLLGGGLAAPLTRRLTRVGLRLMLLPLLEQPTASFVDWVRSEFDSSASTGSPKSSKNNSRAADESSTPKESNVSSNPSKGAKSHGN